MGTISSSPKFATAVIRWQRQHGRHGLPWQDTRDAYRIWLSEVMLQQTQVATVTPYYQRFLERFPNLPALAAAPVAEVMALWSGLGYYARARNLHRCAQQIVADHGGAFPFDPALIAKLPGIGRSTAAAIAVFAFSARAAILDGNVKRVLTRTFGIDGDPSSRLIEQQLWSLAEALLPKRDVEIYTQGLMDLGATVCSRSKPLCHQCPLARQCIALATDRVAELPARKPSAAVPDKRIAMLVVINRNEVLLEQRPNFGIWGGLLSLPEIEWPQSASAADIERLTQTVAPFGELESCQSLPPFAHSFTHFRLLVHPFKINLKRRTHSAAQSGHHWHRLDRIDPLGLPAPVRKLLERLSD